MTDIDILRRALLGAHTETERWRMACRITAGICFGFTVATVWSCLGIDYGLFSGALVSGLTFAWCAYKKGISESSRDLLMQEVDKSQTKQVQP